MFIILGSIWEIDLVETKRGMVTAWRIDENCTHVYICPCVQVHVPDTFKTQSMVADIWVLKLFSMTKLAIP